MSRGVLTLAKLCSDSPFQKSSGSLSKAEQESLALVRNSSSDDFERSGGKCREEKNRIT